LTAITIVIRGVSSILAFYNSKNIEAADLAREFNESRRIMSEIVL